MGMIMKDGIPYGGIYPIDDAPTQGSNNAVKSGGVFSALSNKVDKVEGKGLSTNDYDNTEKGKVADNTGAIEAMVNANGSCNILPAYRGTYTENGVVFTANSDGTVTVDATQTGRTQSALWFSELFSVKSTLTYNVSGCPSNGSVSTYCLGVDDANYSTKATDTGEGDSFTGQTSVKSWIYIHPNFVGTLTFKPMIHDARLHPSDYVPYAMTNEQLTDETILNRGLYYGDSITLDGHDWWYGICFDHQYLALFYPINIHKSVPAHKIHIGNLATDTIIYSITGDVSLTGLSAVSLEKKSGGIYVLFRCDSNSNMPLGPAIGSFSLTVSVY